MSDFFTGLYMCLGSSYSQVSGGIVYVHFDFSNLLVSYDYIHYTVIRVSWIYIDDHVFFSVGIPEGCSLGFGNVSEPCSMEAELVGSLDRNQGELEQCLTSQPCPHSIPGLCNFLQVL